MSWKRREFRRERFRSQGKPQQTALMWQGAIMDILYRRFALVVAFIAAMGALTANLIQETRTTTSNRLPVIEFIHPAMKADCQHLHQCSLPVMMGAETVTLA